MQTQWTSRDRQLASRACKAVELLGFSKDATEGVLRSLLGAYENSWEFIMANNYRVLVEALLDQSVEPATAETAPSTSLRGPSIPPMQTQETSRDRQIVSRAYKAVEMMGFSKDVTEQKRQRRELDGTPRQHSEKGKGKLVDPTPSKPAEPEVPVASSSQPPQGSGRLDSTLNEVPPATVPPGLPFATTSKARVGDEDCCADCYGAAPIPCVCARETEGEFAYTQDGLVKKKFLDDCICAAQYPRQDGTFYCKICPLERSKNEVFHTDDGKGFGVRTLDDLPRGTFVCEYVGEIFTNIELYNRNLKAGNARHTYPVLLDADWESDCLLKDEDAICSDATFCGNVARFFNHRCTDANLIEIPVEIETPDRQYHHLAFFTTRKIEAFEELTWDYGIDFDDHNAFHCLCGSQYCRHVKSQSDLMFNLEGN